ncbi:MAG: serpin family protein [Deferrisomatales bacterium]
MPAHLVSLFFLLAATLPVAGCSRDSGQRERSPPQRIAELPRALSVAEHEVVARSNELAFDLLRETYARETERPNVFLSPLSASMALGMALNGAAGETFEAMRATLRFEGLTQEEINVAYRDLVELLLGLDPGVELLIANAAWARQGWPFVPEFFATIETWFDARARELDFDEPAALDAINRWADEQTGGRIPKVLDEIGPEHVLFLLNAVSFRGDWTHRFERSRTRPGPFTLADGTQVEVQRMSGTLGAGVRQVQGGVQIGELPYGGQAFVMTLALPPPGGSLAALVAGLDAGTWSRWTEGLPEDYAAAEIEVGLPKLELSYERVLNDVLTALGMGVAFDENLADFSRLLDLAPPLNAYLDFVKQNTYLRVDEEGTQAAAVTTVGVGVTSAPPSFVVDRPYLLVIRERLSGTILFLGAIGDPRDGGG